MFGNPETYSQRAGTLLGMSGDVASSFPARPTTFSRKAVPDTHYYDLLGVAHTATQDEIGRAFQEARRRNHPDAPGGSAAMFLEVQEAYKVLSNETTRKAYNTYGLPGAKMAQGSASGNQIPSSGFGEDPPCEAPAWGSFDRRPGAGFGGGRTRNRFEPFSGVSVDDAWSTGSGGRDGTDSTLEDLYSVRSMFDYGEKLPAETPIPKPTVVSRAKQHEAGTGVRPRVVPSVYAPTREVREIVSQVKTTLSELRFHQEREVTFRLPASLDVGRAADNSSSGDGCVACDGKGSVLEYEGQCSGCNGSGREDNRASVAFQLSGSGVCRWCLGDGRQAISKTTCETCKGSGRVAKSQVSSRTDREFESAAGRHETGKNKVVRVPVRAAARDGEVVAEVDLGSGCVGRAVVSEQKHVWLRREKEEGQNLWVTAKRWVEGRGWEIPYLDESGRDAFWGRLPNDVAKSWKAGDVVKVSGQGLVPGKSHLYVVLRPANQSAAALIGQTAKPATLTLQRLTPEECRQFNVPTVGSAVERHDIENALDLP